MISKETLEKELEKKTIEIRVLSVRLEKLNQDRAEAAKLIYRKQGEIDQLKELIASESEPSSPGN